MEIVEPEEFISETNIQESMQTSVFNSKDFEKYVKENKTEVWYRGYSANTLEELEKQTKSMLEGKAKISGESTSASGKGLYFTNNKSEAKGYAEQREGNQKNVITATLNKNAKLASHDDLNKLYSQKNKRSK